jgi:hypothetical protein
VRFYGYVVYFDPMGQPFYFVNGFPHYVPHAHPQYAFLAAHYVANQDAYRRWVQRHGVPVPSRGAPALR